MGPVSAASALSNPRRSPRPAAHRLDVQPKRPKRREHPLVCVMLDAQEGMGLDAAHPIGHRLALGIQSTRARTMRSLASMAAVKSRRA